jgi:hypothetical protein
VTVQVVRVVAGQVAPPGVAVTVYPVMFAPPLSDGAVHETTDEMFAFEVAVTLVGAPGVVAGAVAVVALEMTLVPAALIATTLYEYEVPLMRPLIVHDVAVVVHTTAALVASVIV